VKYRPLRQFLEAREGYLNNKYDNLVVIRESTSKQSAVAQFEYVQSLISRLFLVGNEVEMR